MTSADSLPCAECGRAVRAVPRGWESGMPVYCADHIALTGRDPRFIIPHAIKAAEHDLMTPAAELVDWCLPSINGLLGYLLPGTVTYGCAFPKNGKTAFLANNLAYWEAQNIRPWVMPTESRPKGLVTRLAAARVNVSVDELMSRRLRRRADDGDREALRQLTDVMRAFSEMMDEHTREGASIAIEPAPRLTRDVFRQSVAAAAAGGYGLVVVDHVDHISGDASKGESGYAASEAVQHDALEFAERYDLPILLMSQLNTSRVHRDALYRYKRPVTDWLWMKGVKDQIAHTMFGIYRPMLPDVDDKLLEAVRDQRAESWRVAMPNTMALADMLSRFNGARPDQTLLLHYEDGKISEKPQADEWSHASSMHGIPTGSPSMRRVA